MFYGQGRGVSTRSGMGLGFRGSSPPWPYVGRGRGGLPRCAYFFGGAAGTPAVPGYVPFAPQIGQEEELGSLKGQAGTLKQQLEQIEARIQELEGGSKS